jgi:hypothetical protein
MAPKKDGSTFCSVIKQADGGEARETVLGSASFALGVNRGIQSDRQRYPAVLAGCVRLSLLSTLPSSLRLPSPRAVR